MGKRGKRRNRTRQQLLTTTTPSSPTPMMELLQRFPKTPEYAQFSLPPLSPEDLNALSSDVFGSIDQIYSEYLNDYISRQRARTQNKLSLDAAQQYNLVVDSGFRRKLKEKFTQLSKLCDMGEVFQLYEDCITKFIEQLRDQLIELEGKSPLLQTTCLNEAYMTLKSAASEMSKITCGLFRDQRRCQNMNCILFDEIIMSRYEILSDYARQFSSKNPTLATFLRHIDELHAISLKWSVEGIRAKIEEDQSEESFYQCTYEGELNNESQDSDESYNDITQGMSLDQLVDYINSDKSVTQDAIFLNKFKIQGITKELWLDEKFDTGQGTSANLSKNSTSTSESGKDKVDKEVEEFRRKLEELQKAETMVKPKLSQEYLDGVKATLSFRNTKKSSR